MENDRTTADHQRTDDTLARALKLCHRSVAHIEKTRRVPVEGESSMCMMCLKYRIILLIVIKNPWVILLTYFLLRVTLISDHSLAALPFRHPAINAKTAA